jgi:hypothetical protein
MRSLFTAFIAIMFTAEMALASPLAPAKASEVVNLFAFPLTSAICCDSSTFAFDHRLDSDGTRSSFTIPTKETLVVTEVDWLSLAGTSGTNAIASVVIANNSGCDRLGARSVGVNDAAGNAGGTLVFPTGIVLRRGTQICVPISGGDLNSANVHGFLAKDQ